MVVQVVAAGSLWGSGLPRVWGFGEMPLWLAGKLVVDGVTAGWDCDGAGFGWSEPLLVSPMLSRTRWKSSTYG